MNTRLQKVLFAGTSQLTDAFPVLGRHVLDGMIRPTYGSRAVAAWYARRNRAEVRRVQGFRRFLVIPDIHIGDAVMSESWLTAIRDFFPDAEIDYVINRTVAPLIEGTPDATRVLPLFSGGALPSPDDIAGVRALIRDGRYDLCFCSSPFIDASEVAPPAQPFLHLMSHGAAILRNEADPVQINHFSYQGYRFVHDLLATVARPVRESGYPGLRIRFADGAIADSRAFAAASGIATGAPVVMLNPDCASKYTLLPFDRQAALLRALTAGAPAETLFLVGAGHTEAGIGERLLTSLPESLRSRVRIVPASLPLATYAAVIDVADVFISGDTGPLHLAAARRSARSGADGFRNRTAVLSIFGATPPRMSGYDSTQAGYLAASQDAPSWCYQAGSPCRNVTCVNKLFKTCATVRCFEEVNTTGLAAIVIGHLQRMNGATQH